MKIKKSNSVPVALVSLFCSVLVACGGSGDSSSAPSPPPPPPPPAPAPPAPPPTPENLPVVVNGEAVLYAGTLEHDEASACGRVDSVDPLKSRFGLYTNSMITASDGSIYLTDAPCGSLNDVHAIRRIASDGTVSTVANGAPVPTSDSPLSSFVIPNGIAIDKENNLYVSDVRDPKGMMDNSVCFDGEWSAGLPFPPRGQQPGIWKISPAGAISIFAGVYSQAGDGPNFVDGVGQSASFKLPGPIAFSDDGLLHLIDNGGANSLHYRTIDADSMVITNMSSYSPNILSSANGVIYATTGCNFESPGLVNVHSGEVVANKIPNSTVVAVDSSGNIYSSSSDGVGDYSAIYRKAPDDSAFFPVVTNAYDVRAIAIGKDDALYLKSAYSIIKVTFD